MVLYLQHLITSFRTSSASCSFLSLFPFMISCLISWLMLCTAGKYPANFRLSWAISAGSPPRSEEKIVLSSPTSLSISFSSFSSFVGSSKWSYLENASAKFTFLIPFLLITMNSNWANSGNQCGKMLLSDFILTMYFRLDASV